MRALTKMLATLAVASVLIFLVLAVLPGDVASFLASRSNTRPTEESLHLIREQFGLDQPVLLRYGNWLGNALMGDFGESWLTGAPVAELIAQRIGPTLLLGLSIFMLGSVITFVWGGFAGLKPGRWPDKSLTLLAILGTTLPSFVLGLLAIRLFANELGWASVIGDGSWRTVLLPAAVGGIGLASYWARPFRGLVAEALASGLGAGGQGTRPWRNPPSVPSCPAQCTARLPSLPRCGAGWHADGNHLDRNSFFLARIGCLRHRLHQAA